MSIKCVFEPAYNYKRWWVERYAKQPGVRCVWERCTILRTYHPYFRYDRDNLVPIRFALCLGGPDFTGCGSLATRIWVALYLHSNNLVLVLCFWGILSYSIQNKVELTSEESYSKYMEGFVQQATARWSRAFVNQYFKYAAHSLSYRVLLPLKTSPLYQPRSSHQSLIFVSPAVTSPHHYYERG